MFTALIFTLIFITSVIVVEVLGLGWALMLREGYQYHERRAYGFPDFRMPLWARAYWTAILVLLFLSLGEVTRGGVPLLAAVFSVFFALAMVVKLVIYAWVPRLREKLVTLSWPRIAISRGLLAGIAFLVLIYSLR